MAKNPGHGTIVKHGTSVSPTDVLANVKSIKIDAGEYGEIDVTTLDSATVEDWLLTPLRKCDGLRIVIEWDPALAGHEAIRAAYAAKTTYYFTVVFNEAGAAQYAFVGKLLAFTPEEIDAGSSLRATIVFKANAASTYTQ